MNTSSFNIRALIMRNSLYVYDRDSTSYMYCVCNCLPYHRIEEIYITYYLNIDPPIVINIETMSTGSDTIMHDLTCEKLIYSLKITENIV